jgi:iron complex outermembrane receptor protein
LKQEESKSASIGFTAKIQKETLTADAYTRIDDRVTLTDQFSRPSGTFAAGTPIEKNFITI